MRGSSVVVAHGSTTLPACVLAGTGTRVPLVYRSVGDPRYWASTLPKRVRTAALLRRATRVVALTREAGRAIEEHYRVPADRIVVIPKGVSGARIREPDIASKPAARSSLGLPNEGVVALYLGALSPEKNVGMAIQAVGHLDGIVLAVAGSGPTRSALEDQASELPAGRVRFLGQLSDPAVALSAADLLVLPSHTEGMPGVAMEAGMAGLPVVATDVGWVSDIVLDGETGVLTAPDDPDGFAAGISTALEQRAVMGPAARAHCLRSFDIEAIAGRWAEMLTSVASRHLARTPGQTADPPSLGDEPLGG
jgi:glycosyltransferase involved in cell wall biosynthesis